MIFCIARGEREAEKKFFHIRFIGVEAWAKELLATHVEDYLGGSESSSSPVCLLCAQHPGRDGWGHFMRMLALKRALEVVVSAKQQSRHSSSSASVNSANSANSSSAHSSILALGASGIPSASNNPPATSRHPKTKTSGSSSTSKIAPTSPSPQIVFSTLARPRSQLRSQPQSQPHVGSPRSQRSSIEETVSLRKKTSLLDANERRTVLEFPTPHALLKWARVHHPSLIVLDTRERGMTILPHLVKMGVWIIVLDSRHSFAFTHAHILLSTLAEPTFSKVRQPSRHPALPPEFSQLDRRPNFERLWEEWLPVSSLREETEDVDLAVPQERGQSQLISKWKGNESPQAAKLKQGESQPNPIHKVSFARESRFVLYIGGIPRPTYWKQAFTAMITLIYIQWSQESQRRHELSQQQRQEAAQEPFECIIFVDDSAAARPIWNERLKAVTEDLLKRVPIYLDLDLDLDPSENKAKRAGRSRTRLKKIPLRTRFSKRVPEPAFRKFLAESEFVLTHPGLTAQAALSLGCTLFLLAPTPYLARIAQGESLAPFYTYGTQALMQVMRRSSRSRVRVKEIGSSPENALKKTSENTLDHARRILDAVRTSAANHSLAKQHGRSLVTSQSQTGSIAGGKIESVEVKARGSRNKPMGGTAPINENASISDSIGREWTLPSLIDRMLTKSRQPPKRICPHCAGEELVCVRVPLNPDTGKSSSRIRFRNTLFCPACKMQRYERLSVAIT